MAKNTPVFPFDPQDIHPEITDAAQLVADPSGRADHWLYIPTGNVYHVPAENSAASRRPALLTESLAPAVPAEVTLRLENFDLRLKAVEQAVATVTGQKPEGAANAQQSAS